VLLRVLIVLVKKIRIKKRSNGVTLAEVAALSSFPVSFLFFESLLIHDTWYYFVRTLNMNTLSSFESWFQTVVLQFVAVKQNVSCPLFLFVAMFCLSICSSQVFFCNSFSKRLV
jgi:hypothetical protein